MCVIITDAIDKNEGGSPLPAVLLFLLVGLLPFVFRITGALTLAEIDPIDKLASAVKGTGLSKLETLSAERSTKELRIRRVGI